MWRKCWLVGILLFVVSAFPLSAEGPGAHNDEANANRFDPGTFLFGHIADGHEWHLFTYKDHHFSIYLPVILISQHQGLVVFSSRHFHHGHSSYKSFSVAAAGEHKGKIIESPGDGTITVPLDLSITKNVLSLFISLGLILWIFLSMASRYRRFPNAAPKGMQSFLEPIILFIRDQVARPSIGHHYERFMPFLLTVFFFIWINNMLGLIPIFPGGANLTGNIAVTLVLAFFTFVITNINGKKIYWAHIINMPGAPWWLKIPVPLLPVIEVFSIFTKPFVLMVRLFANITAGHIIALGFVSLIFIFAEMSPYIGYGVSVISILFMVFMTLLELLVAFIQAYVFTFLSALYFGMAVEEHH